MRHPRRHDDHVLRPHPPALTAFVRAGLARSSVQAREIRRGGILERAAELCQTPLAAFMDFSAKHGVPALRYNYEDLEEERRSTDRLEA